MKIKDFEEIYKYMGQEDVCYIVNKGLAFDPITPHRRVIVAAIEKVSQTFYLKANTNVTKTGHLQLESLPKRKKFNSFLLRTSVMEMVCRSLGISLYEAVKANDIRMKPLSAIKRQEEFKRTQGLPKSAHPKTWIETTKEELLRKSTQYERIVLKKLISAFGKRVKSQHPFTINGKVYFADICIKSKKLIIEIDGGYHNVFEQKVKDMARDKAFETIGYKTIRITNEQAKDKLFVQSLVNGIKNMG